MATTPETLQKRFGIPAELGAVAVPRALHGFRGEAAGDQRTMLQTWYPMLMSGAIGAEGQHRAAIKGIRQGVTQQTMAGHAGVRRETITRRLSKLAPAARRSDARARRQKALAARSHALALFELHKMTCEPCDQGSLCAAGTRLGKRSNMEVLDEADYAKRSPGKLAMIFGRRRRFGMASRYTLAIENRAEIPAVFDGEGREVKRFFDPAKAAAARDRMVRASIASGLPVEYTLGIVEIEARRTVYPTAEELAEKMPQWFDANFRSHGFKPISRWIWEPRLLDPDTGRPLGTIERLVMSCYEAKGLLDELCDKDGEVSSPKGWLQIHQKAVAGYLGISTRTLWKCNGKWERLGVLRIVSGKPRQTESGIRRGAMIVLYMPFRTMTAEESEKERQRVERRVREIVAKEGAQRLLQLLEGKRLHGELLTAWEGREHCMGAFWREWRRQMEGARIFPDLIDKLVPPLRPDELNEGWFDIRP